MNRTLLLILVLLISVAGLLALSFQSRPKPAANQTVVVAETSLSLTTPTASTSGILTSNVLINTRTNKIDAVQLELSYNPQDIGNVDIKAGTFMKSPSELFKKVDPDTGRVSYALGTGLGQKGTSGSGVVAVLSFTKLKTFGTTSIDFLPKSLVSSQDVAQSVLKTAKGITFDLAK